MSYWKLRISHTDVFKFDNSYSWTRAKEVYYSIKVLPPHVESEMLGHTLSPSHSNGLANNGEAEEDEFYECNEQITGQL